MPGNLYLYATKICQNNLWNSKLDDALCIIIELDSKYLKVEVARRWGIRKELMLGVMRQNGEFHPVASDWEGWGGHMS